VAPLVGGRFATSSGRLLRDAILPLHAAIRRTITDGTIPTALTEQAAFSDAGKRILPFFV
jgi:hypothetical protein